MAYQQQYYQTPPHFSRYLPLPSPPTSSRMKTAAPLESTSPLITPPNSNETKIYNDFSQRDHRDAGALYDSASETSPMTCFAQPSTQPTHRSPLHEIHPSTQQSNLSLQEAREVYDWHTRDTPYWLDMIKAGVYKPQGVETWDQWQKWRADNGQPIAAKPSLDEYYLAASFLGAIRRNGVLMLPSKPQTNQSKVTKPTSAHRKTGSNGRSVSTHIARASVDSPRRVSRTNNTKASSRGPTGETKSARAPSTKLPKDTNWRHYPDYCPNEAFGFLDPAKAARAIEQARNFSEKKTLNLTQDPDYVCLHPFELKLAERLVLDCSRFLCSKRQIFQGYVEHLQHKRNVETKIKCGLENRGDTRVLSWNKTAAQALMGIDVTKGSWLWSFYNEIGFFDEQYFEPFILSLEEFEIQQEKDRVMFKRTDQSEQTTKTLD